MTAAMPVLRLRLRYLYGRWISRELSRVSVAMSLAMRASGDMNLLWTHPHRTVRRHWSVRFHCVNMAWGHNSRRAHDLRHCCEMSRFTRRITLVNDLATHLSRIDDDCVVPSLSEESLHLWRRSYDRWCDVSRRESRNTRLHD